MKTLGSSVRLATSIAGLFLVVLAWPAAATDVSGTISVNTTWNLAGSPYIVKGSITVTRGVTLTINSGVQVKFDGVYFFEVDGRLTAIGTPTSPIVFTSNTPSPAPGQWKGLWFDT